jgi:hypothetical protein
LTFQCFEFYYRDFPEIYRLSSNLSLVLREITKNIEDYFTEDAIGPDQEDWRNYFIGEIKRLIKSNK